MTENLAHDTHCQMLIDQFDHDRYLTCLYAPEQIRQNLFALYSFNYEISRIREMVSEPMIGEIRLQWWRDALTDITQGGPIRYHDVIGPLATAITAHNLSEDILMSIVDGRGQDLYDESPVTSTDLESYLAQTSGNLSCLAVHIAGQNDIDELAQSLGMAWGYVGLIRSVPYHMSLKKNYIPQDLMEKNGHQGQAFLSPDDPENVAAIIRQLSDKAVTHLENIKQQKHRIKAETRSIFLLSALARSYLKTIERANYNPFQLHEKKDAFFRQCRLLSAALFNRI